MHKKYANYKQKTLEENRNHVFSQDLNGYLRTFVDYNVIDIISNIINICN